MKKLEKTILYIAVILLLGVSIYNLIKVDKLQNEVHNITNIVPCDTIIKVDSIEIKRLYRVIDSLKNVKVSIINGNTVITKVKHDTVIEYKTKYDTIYSIDDKLINKQVDQIINMFAKYYYKSKYPDIKGINELKIGDHFLKDLYLTTTYPPDWVVDYKFPQDARSNAGYVVLRYMSWTHITEVSLQQFKKQRSYKVFKDEYSKTLSNILKKSH